MSLLKLLNLKWRMLQNPQAVYPDAISLFACQLYDEGSLNKNARVPENDATASPISPSTIIDKEFNHPEEELEQPPLTKEDLPTV